MNTTLFTSLVTMISTLDDLQGAKLLTIVNGLNNLQTPAIPTPIPTPTPTPVSNTLTLEEEPSKKDNLIIEGKELWTEDFCKVTQVDKEYRLYITCPVKGDKGDKIRYAIKKNAKDNYGVKWAGEYGTGRIYWAFPTQKSAKQFIADRKERAKEA